MIYNYFNVGFWAGITYVLNVLWSIFLILGIFFSAVGVLGSFMRGPVARNEYFDE